MGQKLSCSTRLVAGYGGAQKACAGGSCGVGSCTVELLVSPNKTAEVVRSK